MHRRRRRYHGTSANVTSRSPAPLRCSSPARPTRQRPSVAGCGRPSSELAPPRSTAGCRLALRTGSYSVTAGARCCGSSISTAPPPPAWTSPTTGVSARLLTIGLMRTDQAHDPRPRAAEHVSRAAERPGGWSPERSGGGGRSTGGGRGRGFRSRGSGCSGIRGSGPRRACARRCLRWPTRSDGGTTFVRPAVAPTSHDSSTVAWLVDG